MTDNLKHAAAIRHHNTKKMQKRVSIQMGCYHVCYLNRWFASDIIY